MQTICFPALVADVHAENEMAEIPVKITITTNNSTKVNPSFEFFSECMSAMAWKLPKFEFNANLLQLIVQP